MDWNQPGPQLSAHGVSGNINAADAATVAMVVPHPIAIDRSHKMRWSRTGLQSLNRLGHGTVSLATAGANQSEQYGKRRPERARRRGVRLIPDRNSH